MSRREKRGSDEPREGQPRGQSPEDAVRSIERRCRGPLAADRAKVVAALVREGRTADAQQADAAGRQGCGYDVNELILSEPLDGKDHSAPCPNCGRTISWRAPRFDSAGSSDA